MRLGAVIAVSVLVSGSHSSGADDEKIADFFTMFRDEDIQVLEVPDLDWGDEAVRLIQYQLERRARREQSSVIPTGSTSYSTPEFSQSLYLRNRPAVTTPSSTNAQRK